MSERNNTILRLALFAVGLAALAAVAALAGRASGIEVEDAPVDAMAHGAESGGDTANGLSDTASGFRFRLETGALRAGAPARLNVRLERDGKLYTQLDTAHGEPPLHLIFVRRDLAGYVHVHPRPHERRVHDGRHSCRARVSGARTQTSRWTAKRSCSGATSSCPASSRHSAWLSRGGPRRWTGTTFGSGAVPT